MPALRLGLAVEAAGIEGAAGRSVGSFEEGGWCSEGACATAEEEACAGAEGGAEGGTEEFVEEFCPRRSLAKSPSASALSTSCTCRGRSCSLPSAFCTSTPILFSPSSVCVCLGFRI